MREEYLQNSPVYPCFPKSPGLTMSPHMQQMINCWTIEAEYCRIREVEGGNDFHIKILSLGSFSINGQGVS